MIRLALFLAMAPLTAAAQGALDVAKHFALFEEFCIPALQGEETLRATLQVPGPNGEKVWSESADGSLVAYQTGRDDMLVIGNYRYGPGATLQECMVQQIGAFAETADQIEATFLSLVPTGEGVVMSGGRVEEEPPRIGLWSAMPAGTVTDRRDFMITGALAPSGTILMASMGQGTFRLNAFHLELAEGATE
ncbi:MAG: hypothetical protein AAFR47_11480 [Pseudomonadota bacterium]